MKKGVIILGATSAIARACAESLAKAGYPLFLAGRNVGELSRIASDIHLRYLVEVRYGELDAKKYTSHHDFIHNAAAVMGGLEGVVFAIGDLGKHDEALYDHKAARAIIDSNLTSACSLLTYAAEVLEKEKNGFIAAIGSVAGDRGRQSNYIYGAAKGGLAIFLEGLRNRLYDKNVRVLTIKPGFIDTAMTFGKKNLFLVASPKRVAKALIRSVNQGRNVIYVPWFWRLIMLLIRSIPEELFKRLKL